MDKVNKSWSPVSCSHQQLWKQLLVCSFASYLMLFKTAAEKLCCVLIASRSQARSQEQQWDRTPSQASPDKPLLKQQDAASRGLAKASFRWNPRSLTVHWSSSLAFQITTSGGKDPVLLVMEHLPHILL